MLTEVLNGEFLAPSTLAMSDEESDCSTGSENATHTTTAESQCLNNLKVQCTSEALITDNQVFQCATESHNQLMQITESVKKKTVNFDGVTVYYFPRIQGFTCVPSQGGSTLGMADRHICVEQYSLSEFASLQRVSHRNVLLEHHKQGRIVLPDDFEDISQDWAFDECYFLQPVPARRRRLLLQEAGVSNIDPTERDECRAIRTSRGRCGCSCRITCDALTCSCYRTGIRCQVDQMAFPCACQRDSCANPVGRVEFNAARVRAHFIRTLLQLEVGTSNILSSCVESSNVEQNDAASVLSVGYGTVEEHGTDNISASCVRYNTVEGHDTDNLLTSGVGQNASEGHDNDNTPSSCVGYSTVDGHGTDNIPSSCVGPNIDDVHGTDNTPTSCVGYSTVDGHGTDNIPSSCVGPNIDDVHGTDNTPTSCVGYSTVDGQGTDNISSSCVGPNTDDGHGTDNTPSSCVGYSTIEKHGINNIPSYCIGQNTDDGHGTDPSVLLRMLPSMVEHHVTDHVTPSCVDNTIFDVQSSKNVPSSSARYSEYGNVDQQTDVLVSSCVDVSSIKQAPYSDANTVPVKRLRLDNCSSIDLSSFSVATVGGVECNDGWQFFSPVSANHVQILPVACYETVDNASNICVESFDWHEIMSCDISDRESLACESISCDVRERESVSCDVDDRNDRNSVLSNNISKLVSQPVSSSIEHYITVNKFPSDFSQRSFISCRKKSLKTQRRRFQSNVKQREKLCSNEQVVKHSGDTYDLISHVVTDNSIQNGNQTHSIPYLSAYEMSAVGNQNNTCIVTVEDHTLDQFANGSEATSDNQSVNQLSIYSTEGVVDQSIDEHATCSVIVADQCSNEHATCSTDGVVDQFSDQNTSCSVVAIDQPSDHDYSICMQYVQSCYERCEPSLHSVSEYCRLLEFSEVEQFQTSSVLPIEHLPSGSLSDI